MKKLVISLICFIVLVFSVIMYGCDLNSYTDVPKDTVLTKYECIESDSSVSESTRSIMEEKLNCKILKNGKLRITHTNVVFDKGNDVELRVNIVSDSIIINEIAPYGISNNYSFYTLTFVVYGIQNGEYQLFIKRNGNPRAIFKINYDSSKAVEYDN